MSYKLEKPYTDRERADFVVLYNHNQGLIIEETDTALYALEADEIMQNGVPVKNPNYAAEQLAQAKAAKYKEANEGARAYLESGEALYELEAGKNIEATDGNIGKLSAYALGFITGQLGAGDVVYWNTKEDETIALTQEQLGSALAGLGAVQAEVWNVKFPAYLEMIEACTSADEVRGIVVDYSLPVEDGAESEAPEELQSGESLTVEEEQDGLIQDE